MLARTSRLGSPVREDRIAAVLGERLQRDGCARGKLRRPPRHKGCQRAPRSRCPCPSSAPTAALAEHRRARPGWGAPPERGRPLRHPPLNCRAGAAAGPLPRRSRSASQRPNRLERGVPKGAAPRATRRARRDARIPRAQQHPGPATAQCHTRDASRSSRHETAVGKGHRAGPHRV